MQIQDPHPLVNYFGVAPAVANQVLGAAPATPLAPPLDPSPEPSQNLVSGLVAATIWMLLFLFFNLQLHKRLDIFIKIL